jgi:hypothetical protein
MAEEVESMKQWNTFYGLALVQAAMVTWGYS